MIVGFLLLGYAALRVLELAPRSSSGSPEDDADRGRGADAGGGVAGPAWEASVPAGRARVLARLVPLHEESALESFRARALSERYGLGDGAPFRLLLTLEALPEEQPEERETRPIRVLSAEVRDAAGLALRPFGAVARAVEGDPVWSLFAAAPAALEVEHARPLVLWGREPGPGARLELSCESEGGSAALEPVPGGLVATRWLAEEGVERVLVPSLESEVARLQAELDRERARRAERELAFFEFSRMLAELPVPGLSPAMDAAPPPPPESEEERERREAAETARARAEELGRALSVLMRLEGLRGLDLLDPGTLGDGCVGPVVFRCLDERGLLTGSVSARRLRLEASQSAHTLTLVLEDGYESRDGERVPFEGGVRRITVDEVDPEPWFQRCSELFTTMDRAGARDDGLWSLGGVRRELNRLLALDTASGWYRVHSLGGVRGTEFLDVQLEELDAGGRLRRRLFADRLSLALEDGSVVLALEDGASVRGEEKLPFRDGKQRIFLPGVPLEAWRSAPLPGFSDPPPRLEPTRQEPEARAATGGG